MKYFETVFLESALAFFEDLDPKTRKKLLYNIRLSEQCNDPKLFKKLGGDIWEFRARYNNQQIRLLAFWDKRSSDKTLVVVSNGLYKKFRKTPKSEIKQAENYRFEYFN
ncbi:MAG: type II toxin-antitoxin system RelE/ParE family toxin [Fluviicola sp.]|nr:type II toxin-antitoxin system RelE/ParE family toxin [Fluviicola sp.]